jgi:integrase
LGSLSGFLKKWHRLGLPGVTADAISLLEELRIKGNQKGSAVLTLDPVDGPFTGLELEAVQSAVNDFYERGLLGEAEYLLAWLFMALGQRPAQFAAMKVCDVVRTVAGDGAISYTLRVPRAKQRTGDPRDEFKERPLIAQIGEPLYDYAERLRERFVGVLDDTSQAPLFPRARRDPSGSRTYRNHRTPQNLSDSLSNALQRLDVRSDRTGQRLHISPVRFRRTFCTRAAQEGHGELVIAELLDHSATQNVGL